MAASQIPFRANTQTSLWPLLSTLGAQTVISPDLDQTFVPNVNPSDQVAPVDRGIPQVYYMHNVMPSTYGFQSIGYKDHTQPNTAGRVFDDIKPIITENGNRTYIAVDLSNTVVVLSPTRQWIQPVGAVLAPGRNITVATVNGVSFITIFGLRTYTYNEINNTLTPANLLGVTEGNVRGSVAASGYLVLWTENGIAWSSVNDPRDFVPSDITGAGGGQVQEAAGDIVHCEKTSYGFIIFTTNNCVSATYSGNSNFPFNFKAISGAGGISAARMVSVETANNIYAYTSRGLQQVYHTGAKTVLPYITDFLAGGIYEDYTDGVGFTQTNLNVTMNKRLQIICDRYLILSYGIPGGTNEYTYAIVVDLVQSRMGKLKINHMATFELMEASPESTETPRDSIGILLRNGGIKYVNFGTNITDSYGVILFGKYQVQRLNTCSLEKVCIDNVGPGLFQIFDQFSQNGKTVTGTFTPIIDPTMSDATHKEFLCNIEARNHSLLIKGSFDINCLMLYFNDGGDN